MPALPLSRPGFRISFDPLRQAIPGLRAAMQGAPRRDRPAAGSETHTAPAQVEGNLPPLRPQLVLDIADSTEDDREYTRLVAQAQFLARQEAWPELGELIRQFDSVRHATPGGLPVAEILAGGARLDAVSAAVGAVQAGDPDGARAPLDALEEVLDEHCEDHGVALVVAMAHIDIGWAWRGEGWRHEVTPVRRAAFHAHFRAAARILDRFDPFERNAPSLVAARCALLAADTRPASRVADDYEDLIDLDPGSPRHMRSLGNHLLPRWFGTYEMLELEARRTAARTFDVWGSGGYTWVYFDALAVDPAASDLLDGEFFVEGIHDILDRRPDQHTANLLAAYTGQTLGGPVLPGSARARVAECFDWIVRDHLREIHPLVWASLPVGAGLAVPPEPDTPLAKTGRLRARAAFARHFADDLAQGHTVVLNADGLQIHETA